MVLILEPWSLEARGLDGVVNALVDRLTLNSETVDGSTQRATCSPPSLPPGQGRGSKGLRLVVAGLEFQAPHALTANEA